MKTILYILVRLFVPTPDMSGGGVKYWRRCLKAWQIRLLYEYEKRQ